MNATNISRLLIARHGKRSEHKVILTFDDGPNPYATSLILDILRQAACPAVFFIIGKWAEQFPDLVKRIVAEGHEAAGHSFTHGGENGRECFSDFIRGNQTIEGITGKPVRFLRVPGFEYCAKEPDGSLRAKELLEGELQLRIANGELSVVDRDLSPADWHPIAADVILDRVISKVQNGSIIDLHDGSQRPSDWQTRPLAMVKALPQIISLVRAKGHEFARIDCFNLIPRWIAV